MKILILTENYPSYNDNYGDWFVHTRCLQYLKEGVHIDVVSFQAAKNYTFEGVSVFQSSDYLKLNKKNNLVVSHAPNIKHHIKFLLKLKKDVPLVFFFHGHEIMKTTKYYPSPYSFNKKFNIRWILHRLYDPIKLLILKNYIFSSFKTRGVKLIFVSKWMQDVAIKCLSLNNQQENIFLEKSVIIPNGVNSIFLSKDFNFNSDKKADFITIRPFDNPKYAMDIVYNIAKNYSNYTFHVYGKGDFFNFHPKLSNLTVFEHYIQQKEIPEILNQYKYALMPTRLDAQGVMMCEIATYKMPLITSDIFICKEMLKGFSNVGFIPNTIDKIELEKYIPKHVDAEKNDKFDIIKLALKEVKIFNEIL
jgi:hypothetical protein